MKARLIHIFLVFCLVSVFSCNKENEPQNEWPSDGKGSFKINGSVLSTEVSGQERDGKFLIFLEHYREQYDELWPWETLGIKHLSKKTDSVQRVFNDHPFITDTVGGSFGTLQSYDVLCDSYIVIEQDSINNWVRIDKQQNDFKEVWGSFSMHMYKEDGCASSLYADTILITDGKFHFSL